MSRTHFNSSFSVLNCKRRCSNHMLNMRENFNAPAFLLEGCAIDPLLDDQQFAKLVARLVLGRRIVVCVTDLTFQDIDAVLDDTRRAQLKATIETLKPKTVGVPAVLVPEKSKRALPTYPGETYPVSEEDQECLLRLRLDGRADARQALAAKWCGATLVTNDRKLVKLATDEGIHAVTTAEWYTQLERYEN